MGLTIYYQLRYKGTEKSARSLVQQLHQAAQDLPFKELHEIVDLKGQDCDYGKRKQDDPLRWLLIQSCGMTKIDKNTLIDVPPKRIIAFETWPGEGCETANFGLCQYPSEVFSPQFGRLRTKLPGWRWSSFCKTQYASDPECGGVENFLRCHLSVVAMLDRAKELGCLEKVNDEGKFWESRDVQVLMPEVASMNKMMAAFAGQVKDVVGSGVEAPITQFSNFEQLELAGQSALNPLTARLAKLIQQVVKHN